MTFFSTFAFPHLYIRPLACLFDWLEAAGVRSWERQCSGVGLTQVLYSLNAWELPDSLHKAVISLPYTEINPLGTGGATGTEALGGLKHFPLQPCRSQTSFLYKSCCSAQTRVLLKRSKMLVKHPFKEEFPTDTANCFS